MSTMSSLSLSSKVPIPKFQGGGPDEFRFWRPKFITRAFLLGYRDLLVGDVPIPTIRELQQARAKKTSKVGEAAKPEKAESSEGTSEAGLSELEDLEKTYYASALAYNDLVQSVDTTKNGGRTAMNLILSEGKSPDYPQGHAARAWANLLTKYTPTTAYDLTGLNIKLSTSRLSPGASPDNYITMMEDIRANMSLMGEEISDKIFISTLLSSLGEQYHSGFISLGITKTWVESCCLILAFCNCFTAARPAAGGEEGRQNSQPCTVLWIPIALSIIEPPRQIMNPLVPSF